VIKIYIVKHVVFRVCFVCFVKAGCPLLSWVLFPPSQAHHHCFMMCFLGTLIWERKKKTRFMGFCITLIQIGKVLFGIYIYLETKAVHNLSSLAL